MAKAYEILISPLPAEEGGGYIAFVPDLHGCMADGETQEEALTNAQDAIAAWCEAQAAANRAIPEPGTARQAVVQDEAQMLEFLQEQQNLIERLKERIALLESARPSMRTTSGSVSV